MKFLVSKRARQELERIERWWKANRPAAPGLFLDELEEAERHLRTSPESGSFYRTKRGDLVRRWSLTKTGHHVYFRYIREKEEIRVLSVWGASRERGPKL